MPLYVIGRIPGATPADEWIVRGNHHDAWVNGAEDPISGLVAELEEARAMGALARQGWKPRRTIVFAAWDGEEQGLLGSTEWAEQHGDELRKHAAVYINTDGNDRGFFGAAGSHTLEQAVNDAARDVADPETGLSVWKRAQLEQIATGTDSTGAKPGAARSADRCTGIGLGLHALPPASGNRLTQPRLRWRGSGLGWGLSLHL